jgi:RNA polymerase sigma-70 factor (family 1)
MKEIKDTKYLLDQLSKSDEKAFRALFHLFSGKVYSFSLKLTRSSITAEEMVQDVFLKLWMNRESMATVENLSAYLFMITKNLALNVLKRKAIEEKAKLSFTREHENKHCDTEETVIHNDYEHLLKATINHLPPQQRLVYSMCHQEGLQYEEVAQRLKISRFTVKTHMQQALKTIKTQFGHIIRMALLFIPISL